MDSSKALFIISSYSSEFSAITVIFNWAYFPLSHLVDPPPTTVGLTLAWYYFYVSLTLKIIKINLHEYVTIGHDKEWLLLDFSLHEPHLYPLAI
jgi:hypothetical protein